MERKMEVKKNSLYKRNPVLGLTESFERAKNCCSDQTLWQSLSFMEKKEQIGSSWHARMSRRRCNTIKMLFCLRGAEHECAPQFQDFLFLKNIFRSFSIQFIILRFCVGLSHKITTICKILKHLVLFGAAFRKEASLSVITYLKAPPPELSKQD